MRSLWKSNKQGRDPRSAPREAGFALLMTLTLLAFLVLLLVGLATYTRIETAIAGNQQRQAQARENALLGLQVALGQLQIHAGPDMRVTATGQSTGVAGAKNYTGVWDVANPGATPRAWLVSGSETNADPAVTLNTAPNPTTPASNDEEVLVGIRTVSDALDRVKVLKQNITAVGVPGQTGSVRVGRYAWWVGDQGVKAPVAVPDASDSVNFAPYDSADLRSRIRQQIALGAGAADSAGAPVFEPRDANNDRSGASLVADANRNPKVTAFNQLALLRNGSNAQLGIAAVRPNFHSWSPNNFAVLADSKRGGLRQDLSVQPDILGAEVKSWLDYTSYMEPPDASVAPPSGTLEISPSYSSDPMRRRYLMQSGPPMISPVLSFLLLSFNVRTLPTPSGNPSASVQPVQVRLRGAFTLWNPYSSALVPENLRLEITGLPASLVLDDVTNPTSSGPIPFGNLFGSPVVKFSLPWSASSATPPTDDRHSWLPGRSYSWTIAEDTSGNTPPPGGYPCVINSQMDSSVFGDGVHRTIPGKTVDGSDQCHIETRAATQFVVTLIAERAGGDVTLGSFTSPRFDSFSTTTRDLGSFTFTPTFVFRLAESDNGLGAWLTTAGIDPRESTLPSDAYTVGTTGNVNGPFPEQYENVRTVSAPDRLLDRDVVSFSYNEDVPVFELPRAPVLSLGQLQHLPLAGLRPFAVGNSWVGSTQLNGINASELFDRYFFSGLAGSITPVPVNGSLRLPNPLLKVLRDPTTGIAADLQGAPNAQSSKFLLQGGAFNLNSTNPVAWAAVLRSVRFVSSSDADQFKFLEAEFGTGTAGDSKDAVPSSAARGPLKILPTDPEIGEASFFRFPQSAQETYKAFPDYAASLADPETPTNNSSQRNPPVPASLARTDLFRKGLRKLTPAQLSLLSQSIVSLIRIRHSADGPFRSLEEFLASASGGGPSLLEQALADAAINNDPTTGAPIEFSSQFLTQADVMTALAPVLFPRSDTFVIRAYGEAVNPATAATEGRAWCEATVQRVPDYLVVPGFDATGTAIGDAAEATPTDPLNIRHGRRFKIVSFRWLTRSDI